MTLPTEDKDRKGSWPLWTFMFEYFPKAWLEVVRVAVEGNKQHNPGEKLRWAREKSTDQLNTAMRHQFDYGQGVKRDTDGVYHLAKAIWRLMAQLQLDIEEEERERAQCGQSDELELETPLVFDGIKRHLVLEKTRDNKKRTIKCAKPGCKGHRFGTGTCRV